MKLKLPLTQKNYDEWFAYHLNRVDNKTFYYVDLNDGIMVLLAAVKLGDKFPEKQDELKEKIPDAVDGAMQNRGMYMGIAWLANQVGLTTEDGHSAMNEVVAGR